MLKFASDLSTRLFLLLSLYDVWVNGVLYAFRYFIIVNRYARV
jgi:hypothetical protein